MKQNQITKARALGVLAALAFGAALSGGACSSSVPSDQTGASSSGGGGKGTSTTASNATASSGGMGGASTTASAGSGTGGKGTGGAPSDCSTNPMTYVEIINACTTAQQVDVMPVLPLLEADGGLPPLP